MRYVAENPERIFDKVRECRFFLTMMADFEKEDTEKFLFCTSGFLGAFRSVLYRLFGVTRTKSGIATERKLKDKLHSHADIVFLSEARDVEIHGDGVKLWKRYTVAASDSIMHSPQSGRFNRVVSRFQSRFSRVPVGPHVIDWQFEGRPTNLIELCYDTLNEVEEIIRQTISVS